MASSACSAPRNSCRWWSGRIVPSSNVLPRLLQSFEEELRALQGRDLLRRLTTIEEVRGAEVRLDGRWLVCWCSNDYLGLSLHPAVIRAAARAAARWGVGARASRLLAGSTALHAGLEDALAEFFGAEGAVVFASGYLANLGTLSALVGPRDLVVVDRLAHASLIDACRASRATLRVFPHNDVAALSRLLTRRGGRRLVVTEGVFSMDGDRAPLAELLDVVQRHDAFLYVDDAHGAGVLGDTGRGSPEEAGVPHEHLLYMGTLGKALGAQGGFVAGPAPLIALLHNRARPFIYATALAPPAAAAALEAL
ncbi:MAG: aminotransferase class I/II-fold pyridoxal phosphate-dependent enzyme, partial [Candidatus Omnitrophica bacterium]|nr:aminotransferase class I/II-fold pyridoxal phosphate-dependent enzyme [Candidatus Omnitrophota bacterium]